MNLLCCLFTINFIIIFIKCNPFKYDHPIHQPWSPIPVRHSQLLSVKPSSVSMISTTTNNKNPKKNLRELNLMTHDKSYTLDSKNFPTPTIEHHPNGATVGLDLPDSNIRLLLDIDELDSKPLTQHIGLKVIDKSTSKKVYETLLNSNNKKDYKNDIHQASSKPVFKSVSNSFYNNNNNNNNNNNILYHGHHNIVRIPVSKNFKIGYIRASDLHTAIHHRIRNKSFHNNIPNNNVISYNRNLNNQNNYGKSITTITTTKANNNRALFNAPTLDTGSFKPLQNYSVLLNSAHKLLSPQLSKTTNFTLTQGIIVNNTLSKIKPRKPNEKPSFRVADEQQEKQQQFYDDNIGFDDDDNVDENTDINNKRNEDSQMKTSDKSQRSITISTNNNGFSINDMPEEDQGFDEEVNNNNVDDDNDALTDTVQFNNNNNNDDNNNNGNDTILNRFSSLIDNNKDHNIRPSFFSSSPSSTSVLSSAISSLSSLASTLSPLITCDTMFDLNDNSLEVKTTLKDTAILLNAEQFFNILSNSEDLIQSIIDTSSPDYTLFLPSNNAITDLPSNFMNEFILDKNKLNQLINNHVIDSRKTIENIYKHGPIETRLPLSLLRVNSLNNRTYTINGKRIIYANQKGPKGGIIHIIDGLLYPFSSKTIIDTLRLCNKFDGFVTLAEGTGLSSLLSQTGPFTIFVPSNEALQKIPEKDLNVIRNNMTALKDFLTYHIVPGAYYSSDLKDGQFISSQLPNHFIKAGIRVDGCSRRFIDANRSPIYPSDISASNGVIHVVQWVLKPSDNDWCEKTMLPR